MAHFGYKHQAGAVDEEYSIHLKHQTLLILVHVECSNVGEMTVEEMIQHELVVVVVVGVAVVEVAVVVEVAAAVAAEAQKLGECAVNLLVANFENGRMNPRKLGAELTEE